LGQKQNKLFRHFGERVSINKSGVGRYGRTIAYDHVRDAYINNELLRLGMT